MTQDRQSVPALGSPRPPSANASRWPSEPTISGGARPGRKKKPRRESATTPDLTAERCQTWLGHHAEACRLSIEWGQVEARLQAKCGWYKLSPETRESHPGQAELDAIQARLDELDAARDLLLPTLADLPAGTRETVALKLAVAAELVDVADFPEAHALIVRARQEMLAL